MNMTLNQVVAAMNNQVGAQGGIDSAIEACDRMYSATFRTEAFVLGAEGLAYNKSSLMADLARHVYTQAGFPLPVREVDTEEYSYFDEDDCYGEDYFNDESDYSAEEYYYECAEEYLKKNFPDLVIDENTSVVELCNYKGEGEGLALACLCEKLPVFRSKNESFYQANSLK